MLEKESWNWNRMDQDKSTLKTGLTAFMTLAMSMLVLHTRICYGQTCISLSLKAPNFSSTILDWCWAVAVVLSRSCRAELWNYSGYMSITSTSSVCRVQTSFHAKEKSASHCLWKSLSHPLLVWRKSRVLILVLLKTYLIVFDCLSVSFILFERHQVTLKADLAREMKLP